MTRTILSGLTLAVLSAAGCAPDDTEENVRAALEQASLNEVAVELDEHSRTVTLSGRVDTLAERGRAEELAAAVVGTSGSVVNQLDVETLNGVTAADEP